MAALTGKNHTILTNRSLFLMQSETAQLYNLGVHFVVIQLVCMCHIQNDT